MSKLLWTILIGAELLIVALTVLLTLVLSR